MELFHFYETEQIKRKKRRQRNYIDTVIMYMYMCMRE